MNGRSGVRAKLSGFRACLATCYAVWPGIVDSVSRGNYSIFGILISFLLYLKVCFFRIGQMAIGFMLLSYNGASNALQILSTVYAVTVRRRW